MQKNQAVFSTYSTVKLEAPFTWTSQGMLGKLPFLSDLSKAGRLVF